MRWRYVAFYKYSWQGCRLESCTRGHHCCLLAGVAGSSAHSSTFFRVVCYRQGRTHINRQQQKQTAVDSWQQALVDSSTFVQFSAVEKTSADADSRQLQTAQKGLTHKTSLTALMLSSSDAMSGYRLVFAGENTVAARSQQLFVRNFLRVCRSTFSAAAVDTLLPPALPLCKA